MKVMTWKSTLPETKIDLANSPLKVAVMIFLFHGICKLPGKSQVPPMYSERFFFSLLSLVPWDWDESTNHPRVFFSRKKGTKINLQPIWNPAGETWLPNPLPAFGGPVMPPLRWAVGARFRRCDPSKYRQGARVLVRKPVCSKWSCYISTSVSRLELKNLANFFPEENT